MSNEKMVKLKDLCITITDGSHYSPKGVKEGIPMLSVKDMRNQGFDYSNCKKISRVEYEKLCKNSCQPKKGDILIAKDGSYLKEIFVVKEEKEEAVLSSIGIVKPNLELVDPYYIKYYLSSSFVKKEVSKKYVSGSALPRIILKNFANIEIPYLELKKQQKIVKILKSLDDKIETNEKIKVELEKMAKVIYDYWFLQFDFPNKEGKPYQSSGGKMVWNEAFKQEIPQGWQVKEIHEYCNIFTGKKDVNQALEYGTYKFYSCSPDYKFSNEKRYEGKAILVSGNGSYTGRTIFVNEAFDLYQRTYACTNKYKKDYMEYIYYTMLKFFVPKVRGGTHGSAIPYIIYDDIAKQKILINEPIMDRFMEKIKSSVHTIICLRKENEKLIKLKKFLLPMLMNGQVDFKN